jgi:general secretion pathway protein D
VPLLGELFTRRDNTARRTELLIFLRPLLIDDPSTDTDYAPYARELPDADFLVSAPSPGQRNLPSVPLRPRIPALPSQP